MQLTKIREIFHNACCAEKQNKYRPGVYFGLWGITIEIGPDRQLNHTITIFVLQVMVVVATMAMMVM